MLRCLGLMHVTEEWRRIDRNDRRTIVASLSKAPKDDVTWGTGLLNLTDRACVVQIEFPPSALKGTQKSVTTMAIPMRNFLKYSSLCFSICLVLFALAAVSQEKNTTATDKPRYKDASLPIEDRVADLLPR